MRLPKHVLSELERLGESRRLFEMIVELGGLDFAEEILRSWTERAPQFEQFFPELKRFAVSKRLDHPFSATDSLAPIDRAILRILASKIREETLHFRVTRFGAIFTRFRALVYVAPLFVLPLLQNIVPSTSSNAIYLTHDEWHEWSVRFEEDDDWYTLYHWDAERNPRHDDFFMERVDDTSPRGSTPLCVSWGDASGGDPLGFQVRAELWEVDSAGHETFRFTLGGVHG